MFSFFSLFFLLCSSFHTAAGNSVGAGSCQGGQAAVGLPHLFAVPLVRTVQTGTLADGQVQVAIGDQVLNPQTTLVLNSQQDYTLTVTANGTPIKGVLVRIQCQVDLSTAILPLDDLTKIETTCETESDNNSVSGITHTSSTDKTSITATLHVPSSVTVAMDVTVVMANNNAQSIYYYSGFTVRSANPPCEICGAGKTVASRDQNIPQPNNDMNCGVAEDAGLKGEISPTQCAIVQQLAPESCNCIAG